MSNEVNIESPMRRNIHESHGWKYIGSFREANTLKKNKIHLHFILND